MSAADKLAAELRRLSFDVQNPHRFQDAKRDLAARVAGLVMPSPCAACDAHRLRAELDNARRAARAERARADRAERLVRNAVKPSRKRARRDHDAQLALFEPAELCESQSEVTL